MQHDFILLDRSGSMETLWTEALSSVNAYVKKLAEDGVDTGVTLACFDTGHDGKMSFDILRDRIIPSTWHAVTSKDAAPRGGTPLNDATGKVVALADAGNYDKVAIVIMTDGHENSSRELTVDQAKALLDNGTRTLIRTPPRLLSAASSSPSTQESERSALAARNCAGVGLSGLS